MLRRLLEKVRDIDAEGISEVLRSALFPDLTSIALESEDAVVYRYLSSGRVVADFRRTARIAELGIAVEPPGTDVLRTLLGAEGIAVERRLYLVISYPFPMNTVVVRARWDGAPQAFFYAAIGAEAPRIIRVGESGVENTISGALERCLAAQG